jgi:hypothetical protein
MSDIHWKELKNLILVAGHAIYTAESFNDPTGDESWLLQPFQKGEPPFYVEHIHKGVELAATDPLSLLLFSGGQTRAGAGPRSEAQSYWMIARHFLWWESADVESRATTEEFARDSFENLLFGICRFFECAGRYPETIRVVGWAFKARRFDLHRAAINFPKSKFLFSGVNNPVDLERAQRGEEQAIALFEKDPYGAGDQLGSKREERNPFNRSHPYEKSNPKLIELLRHRGTRKFEGSLPWSRA